MNIHMVGGFLGSGKTTAIVNACRGLISRGTRPGVITNDQGRFLVDSAFVRAADLPAVEVGGGCFCCNYTDYRAVIARLDASAHPSLIFAESVGSCADIVATVIKPSGLESSGHVASFSVFTDVRLFERWIRGLPFPFGTDVTYLYEQQLAEAQVIVLNKADLVPAAEGEQLVEAANRRFPQKTVLLLSSLPDRDVSVWLETIGAADGTTGASDGTIAAGPSLDIDYHRYGAAEASLAWFDATVEVAAGGSTTQQFVVRFVDTLHRNVDRERRAIGHIKVIAFDGGETLKASITSADQSGGMPSIQRGGIRTPGALSGPARLTINARVEAAPDDLARLVESSLRHTSRETRRTVTISNADSFSPSFPRPTHRIP